MRTVSISAPPRFASSTNHGLSLFLLFVWRETGKSANARGCLSWSWLPAGGRSPPDPVMFFYNFIGTGYPDRKEVLPCRFPCPLALTDKHRGEFVATRDH